jgi:xanthine dehydrogenase accessory factor
LIRGAGDLATGAALSFHAAGFRVIMTELAQPLAIRRTVSFASAVYQGSQEVEGVRADRCDAAGWLAAVDADRVAVLVDPRAEVLADAAPAVIVDAIMAKSNLGTSRVEGTVVIALGPGFTAGRDADAVVETARGHELGRIIREGSAQTDTGTPGEIAGRSSERVLRAPRDGRVTLLKSIGDLVTVGETVLLVGDTPVPAPFDGCLRGVISAEVRVTRGVKIGDVDPRGRPEFVHAVSDKARAVGRAALDAALLIGRERGLLALKSVR